MFAKEQSVTFENQRPIKTSIYQVHRQMPHYHRDALEIIMCLRGTIEVYSMHENHVLHAGDIKEADTYDIHTATTDDPGDDNLVASFHFDLTHPLFAGKGYDLLYYVCSSDGIDNAKKPALDELRKILWALLYEEVRLHEPNKIAAETQKERINELSYQVLQMLRNNFQYFNDINLDDTYSKDMQNRFEHIIAYML